METCTSSLLIQNKNKPQRVIELLLDSSFKARVQCQSPARPVPHDCTEPLRHWATAAGGPGALAGTGGARRVPGLGLPPPPRLPGGRAHWPVFWGEHMLFSLSLFFLSHMICKKPVCFN